LKRLAHFCAWINQADQNWQPYDFMDCFVCSILVLHVAANVALVCGLAASSRHDFVHCSKVFLYWDRAASGTRAETQAAYFSINASHSGTPILPVVAVVDAGVVVDVAVFEVAEFAAVELWLFEFVWDEVHAATAKAIATQNTRRVLLNICSSLEFSPVNKGKQRVEMEKQRHHTRKLLVGRNEWITKLTLTIQHRALATVWKLLASNSAMLERG
jgi:hypothetical protein